MWAFYGRHFNRFDTNDTTCIDTQRTLACYPLGLHCSTIVKNLATAIAEVCPKANTLIISNPVNSTVPIVAEVFKKFGTYNPKR